MSIREDFEKNQTNKRTDKAKDIGNGTIKIEIKDGHIEATSHLDIPKSTLVMVLIVMEVLQRAIVENNKKINSILKNLRRISNSELLELVKENAEILKAGPYESNNN